MMAKPYGMELIIDLHDCDPNTFTKQHISVYFKELCDLIGMKRFGEPMFWVENRNIPHLKGVSGVQFIETSNITIHAPIMLRTIYINIFSCKPFFPDIATEFSKNFFRGKIRRKHLIERT